MGGTNQRMTSDDRRRQILSLLSSQGIVHVATLSQTFGVSTVTIRTDLSELEYGGKLKRIHGGAVSVKELVVPSLPKRMRRNTRAKDAIGHAAAGLVTDGETILVGSGSTTLAFVNALNPKTNLSIITDEPGIINYVTQRLPNVTPICTGGILGCGYHYYGPLLAASLANVHVDKAFLGADGFERHLGFLAERKVTAEAKKEFMKHSDRTVILMDATKVGASRFFVPFAMPGEIDLIIMDSDPHGIVATSVRAAGGRTHVIEVCT